MTCTYKFQTPQGEVTLTGQSQMKAYLADVGLEELGYKPEGGFPWDAKSSKKDDGVLFSKELPEKSLAIIHNLSLDNLIHSDKFGGIAAPSVAVVNKNHPMSGFGEITLVANKDTLGPHVSKKNKYFNADIYSPRYPSINYIVEDKEFTKFINGLSDKTKKLQNQLSGRAISKSDIEDRGIIKGLEYSIPMRYEFLLSQNKAPAFTFVEKTIIPKSLQKYIDKAGNDYFISRDDDFKKASVDQYNSDMSSVDESLLIKDMDSREARSIASNTAERLKIAYKEKKEGRLINIGDLDKKISEKVDENKYKAWLSENYSHLIDKERIFDGYTNSGNRRYLDHNLDNVVRILTREVRGGEGFNYGVPSIRAHAAKQFKTIKSLQDNKDSLVTKKVMEDLKKEVNDEFNQISESLSRYAKYSTNEASEALSGLASKGYREFREYYDNVPTDVMQDVVSFLDKLKHMPSEYFEGKIGRAVSIGEFEAAIVPKGKEYENAISILKKHGITNIKRYSNDEGRSEALKKIDNLLFQKDKLLNKGSTTTQVHEWLTPRQRKMVSSGVLKVVQSVGDSPHDSVRASEIGGIQGYYNRSEDMVVIIADSIPSQAVLQSVLAHEFYHRAEKVDTLLRSQLKKLDNRLSVHFNMASKGIGSEIELKAYKRVMSAETFLEDQISEYKAYLVTEYHNNPENFKGTILQWIKDLYHAIRAALIRQGIMPFTITSADLNQLVAYGYREPSRRSGSGHILASQQAARFYSALRRAFVQAPEKVFGNPVQVKAWINGNAPKYDVKKDEIYWSGLNEFLDLQQGKITRDDMLNFLDKNGVQVEDVVLDDINGFNPEKIRKELEEEILADASQYDYADGAYYYDIIKEKRYEIISKIMDSEEEIEDEDGDVIGYKYTYDGEIKEIDDNDEDSIESAFDLDDETIFNMIDSEEIESYAQEALKNSSDYIDQEISNRKEQWEMDHYDDDTGYTKHNNEKLTLPGGKDYRELVITIPTVEKYNENDEIHFGLVGQGRQIFWVRHNTRGDSLFLEEMQSQRGSDGRTKGFKYKIEPLNPGNFMDWMQDNKKIQDKEIIKSAFGDENNVYFSEWKKIKQKYHERPITPPAPFITDSNNKATNAYITLALKKAISQAVDDGLTSVSWTTGSQQADRYDLSKQVDSLQWIEENSYLRGYKNDSQLINQEGVTKNNLADYVGKDVADKLINMQADENGSRIIDGEALQVGGGWTQSMYGNEQGLNAQGKPSLIMQSAMEIARKMGGEVKSIKLNTGMQPALIITPQMRDKVINEGMPLFSKNTGQKNNDIRYSVAEDDSGIYDDSGFNTPSVGKTLLNKINKLADKAQRQTYGALTVRQLATIGRNIMPQLKEFGGYLQKREALQNHIKNQSGQLLDQYWKKLDKLTLHRTNKLINDSSLNDINAAKAWEGVEKTGDKYTAWTQNAYGEKGREKVGTIAANLGGTIIGKTKVTFDNEETAKRFLEQIKGLRVANTDKLRKIQHVIEQRRYNALPDKAKHIYNESYKQLDELFNRRMSGLEKRIENAIDDNRKRAAFIAAMRQQFESNKMNWYYAPLSRFGDYWLYGIKNDKKFFQTFESPQELATAKENFDGQLIGTGLKVEGLEKLDTEMVGEGFIANVQKMLIEAEAPIELQDEIYQMFLSTLPAVSMRKNAIHREGVAGFEPDAMRSFANAAWHGSKQLSNLVYNADMSTLLANARTAIDMAASTSKKSEVVNETKAAQELKDNWADWTMAKIEQKIESDPTNKQYKDMLKLRKQYDSMDVADVNQVLDRLLSKNNLLIESAEKIASQEGGQIQASKIVSELNRAYEDMQKPGYSPIATFLMQFNFITMLGLSPSFFLVNTLQTPGVAMPRSFGRFGNIGRVNAEYGRAYKDFMDSVIHLRKDEFGNLSMLATLQHQHDTATDAIKRANLASEIIILKRFMDEGDVDNTMGYDLIGISEEGIAQSGALSKVAKASAFMAHHSERMNREITLMANYRLGKSQGLTTEKAIETARELNIDSHMDYSSENAGRFMRSPGMKLLTQFMKYKQGMYFLWMHSLHTMRKGRSLEERQESRRIFFGLMTMQTAFAGTLGIPSMGALIAVLNVIGGMFDDDDDKWDTKKELRLGLHKVLDPMGDAGYKLAETILYGAVNALTPIELHNRMDLSDVLIREPIKEMEGRDEGAYRVAGIMGPTAGNVMDFYESIRLANDGLWARSVETFPMMPKFGTDFLKAIRYANENATTQKGAVIKEMDAQEIMLQALGFSSSYLSRQYDENRYKMERETQVGDAKSRLIADAAKAKMDRDNESFKESWADIQEFNRKYPELHITMKNIIQSMRKRRSNQINSDHGLAVKRRLRRIMDEENLTE